MLGEEGMGKGPEGLGGQRRGTFACAPLSFRTGRGSGDTLAHVRRCTVRGRGVAGGSSGTDQRCSSHVASVPHSDSETGIVMKGLWRCWWGE